MMKQLGYRQIGVFVALAVISFAGLGCQGDGPEFIVGDTRIIEGTLGTEDVSHTSFFALTNAGTVSILASTLRGANPETGVPIENPMLGFSVGAPDPADETQCQLTFSNLLAEGESFSVYFQEGIFCITAFRPPETLDTAVYEYVVTMTGAFS